MDKRFTRFTSAWLQKEAQPDLPITDVSPSSAPIVIVGTGPVGVRVAQEIMRQSPDQELIIYGQEAYEPYNRAALSSLLSGDLAWEELNNDINPPQKSRFNQHINCTVKSINASGRWLTDSKGRVQHYSRLILATGSQAHIPDIRGTDLSGVFTFRNKDDALSLIKRREQSRHTIVIGGGPLGIEVARAMQLGGARVTLLENRKQLLNRHLDEAGSTILKDYIESLGIQVNTADPAAAITGKKKVTGVRLKSGKTLKGDTVILATGISANTELAEAAGLRTVRGITVNDYMRTSDPYIYAVGECAEHRDKTYGLVSPGLAQAEVAACNALDGTRTYEGSVTRTQLKVLGKPIEFIGHVYQSKETKIKTYTYVQPRQGTFRKLFVRKGRVIGVAIIGDWADSTRLRPYVEKKGFLMPWRLWRFERTGELWSDKNQYDIRFWPNDATVCYCQGITKGDLKTAIKTNCPQLDMLMKKTGAGIICGTCRPLLSQLLDQPDAEKQNIGNQIVLAAALIGLGFIVLMMLPPWQPTETVQGSWHWSKLWFDGFWKQFSGYSLLVFGMAGLLLSLRKRWPAFSIGTTENWRLAHMALGTSALFMLVMHTGLRTGINLNFVLSASFLAMAALGAVTALLGVFHEKSSNSSWQKQISSRGRLHIYLAWPVPILLLFHIVTVYYF